MTVCSFSIDIIIDKQDNPYILEFNRAMSSGANGYDKHNRQRAFYKVLEDIRKFGNFDGVWVTGGDVWHFRDSPFSFQSNPFGFAPNRYDPSGSPSKSDDIAKGLKVRGTRHVIFPSNFHDNLTHPISNDFFAKSIIDEAKSLTQGDIDITIADRPISADNLYIDKKVTTGLIAAGVFDQSFFPGQEAYTDQGTMTASICEKFAGRAFLLKNPVASKGEGIARLSPEHTREDIEVALEETISPRYDLRTDLLLPGNMQKITGVVAQELIACKRISVREAFRRAYDWRRITNPSLKRTFKGTHQMLFGEDEPRNNVVRLFCSYINGKIITHCGYYKFANTPEESDYKTGDKLSAPLADGELKKLHTLLAPTLKDGFDHLSRNPEAYPMPEDWELEVA